MKKITIVSSCYNESLNLEELYQRVTAVFDQLKDKYNFEYILADNGSTDDTANKLRELAQRDGRFKIILNSRNFGHIRSPHHLLLSAQGDAIILIVSDLQDPPELIAQLLQKWEEGYKIVLLKKRTSGENKFIFFLRELYYRLLAKISDNGVKLEINCTGSGLIDARVQQELQQIEDPYPYYRGLLCELGFERAYVLFDQPKRKKGVSANNLYTLYDMVMLGIVKNSKLPLRIMAFIGFLGSFVTFLVAIFYLVWKLVHWDTFPLGIAPLIIGIMFLGSVLLFCLGVLGEYVLAIYTRIDKKPLVVEKERINF